MERTTVRELYCEPQSYAGKQVRLAGWAKTVRAQKNFGFIDLADGSFFKPVQIVLSADQLSNYAELSRQGSGSSFWVTGLLKLTPGSRQPFEIQAESVSIEGTCPPDYPLQPKRHSPEFLRTVAHLRPRTNLFSAVFRVRSVAAFAIHRFFQEQNFIYVQTPLITGSDAEGAGEMFQVTTLDPAAPPLTADGQIEYKQDFFGKRTFLTVSGQLNAEAFAQAFAKVYTFGPTFRAENSNTARHAAEFWMVEPEIAFADLQDDMQLAEHMLKAVIAEVLDKCPEEMAFFNRFVDDKLLERMQNITQSDFAALTYTQAITELEKVKDRFKYPVFWGCDLQTEHERFLTEELIKAPVFVTDYPREIKAFYMRNNPDGKTVAAMDCLVPGIGEIIGGSQREERLDVLTARMAELGMNQAAYEWYLDLRRYGSTHHAGFGLGFERLIMYLTSVANIRDVEAFPRTVGSADF
ncbi:MAG: asparagine--tRNA ligase [Oscillospiraceae bacterium]|nr:asparagine--tRNA ligase [Oscillospiraceae bacterium]